MSDVRPSRRRRTLIAIAIVAGGLTVILWDVIKSEWHARDAEQEAGAFVVGIPLGATRQSVAEAFGRGSFRYLRRGESGDDREWFFHTPYRFGAKNWVVVVGFEGERVVSIRVGHLGRPASSS